MNKIDDKHLEELIKHWQRIANKGGTEEGYTVTALIELRKFREQDKRTRDFMAAMNAE